MWARLLKTLKVRWKKFKLYQIHLWANEEKQPKGWYDNIICSNSIKQRLELNSIPFFQYPCNQDHISVVLSIIGSTECFVFLFLRSLLLWPMISFFFLPTSAIPVSLLCFHGCFGFLPHPRNKQLYAVIYSYCVYECDELSVKFLW